LNINKYSNLSKLNIPNCELRSTMTHKVSRFARRVLQEAIILFARPYISRELPGWGRVYSVFVGDYRRDSLWQDAQEKIICGKFHSYLMHLNLAHWADRSAFFLGRWYELDTQLFMKDLVQKGDTVVDIGANRGMFTLCASHLVGSAGKVISFEPNPTSRLLLERELASNGISNVTLIPYGASNSFATLTLDVPLLNSGEATFGKKIRAKNSFYQVEAQVVTGDSQLVDEKPTLIKIDVEGFECRVIEGLAEALEKHHPVVFTEVVQEHLYASGSSRHQLQKLLTEKGYKGYKLLLEKNKKHHVWIMKPALESDDVYNAIWIHENAPDSMLARLNQHVR
jgi:FkbM family methyltransferase